MPSQEKLNSLFFYSNKDGCIFLADDANNSPEIVRSQGTIKDVLFHDKDNSVIVITSNSMLFKCKIYFNQNLNPRKIKMSIAGKIEEIKTSWASQGLIAMVTHDDLVRFYYIETDQSYFLSMNEHANYKPGTQEVFTCIDFNFRKRILIVGTDKGRVYMWKCNVTSNITPLSSESWESFCLVDTEIPSLNYIRWSSYMGLVHCKSVHNKHSILSETTLQKKMNKLMKVVQTNHRQLEVIAHPYKEFNIDTGMIRQITLSENIKGLDLYNNMILAWNGHYSLIYEVSLQNFSLSKVNTLKLNHNLMCLNE